MVTINFDKAVQVKYISNYLNAFNLHFKFEKNGNPLDVSSDGFVFTIIDPVAKKRVFSVISWDRPEVNEIQYTEDSFHILPGTYSVDFTCTFSDGTVQTMATGQMIVKQRNII